MLGDNEGNGTLNRQLIKSQFFLGDQPLRYPLTAFVESAQNRHEHYMLEQLRRIQAELEAEEKQVRESGRDRHYLVRLGFAIFYCAQVRKYYQAKSFEQR